MSGMYGAVSSAVRCLIVVVVAVHLHTLPSAALAALLDLPMIAISAFEIFVLGAPASPRHTRAPPPPESPTMPSSPAFPAGAPRTTPGSRVPPQQPSPGLFPDGPVKVPARNDSEFSLLSGSDGSSVFESPTAENMRTIREQFAPLLHSDDDGGDDDAAEADAEMDSDAAATTRLMRRRSNASFFLPGAGRSGTALPLTAEQVAHAAYVPPSLPTASGMPFCHPLRPAALPAVRERVSPTTPGGAADMDVPSSSEDPDAATISRRPIHRRRRTGGANELLPGSPTTAGGGSSSGGAGGSSAFPPSTAPAVRRPLVRPSGGKVLVLDLDDTLLCSALTASKYATAATYREVVPTGSGADLYHVWERPHVATFLQCVSQWYHLAVFTAAAKPYADVVVDRLERHIPSSGKRMLRRRFYRTDCTALRSGGGAPAAVGPQGSAAAPPAGSYWKDLNKVAPAALHPRMVLLDDTVECFAPQPSNGLVCPRYCPPRHTSLFSAFGAKPAKAQRKPEEDRTLLDLLPLLEALSHTWDVRAVLSHQHHVSALRKRAHTS